MTLNAFQPKTLHDWTRQPKGTEFFVVSFHDEEATYDEAELKKGSPLTDEDSVWDYVDCLSANMYRVFATKAEAEAWATANVRRAIHQHFNIEHTVVTDRYGSTDIVEQYAFEPEAV
jgi:hypothetical protein